MNIEKKTIRSDIPGHQNMMVGNAQADEARRMVVARDIALQGSISACDYLVVEGVVQAQSFVARRMDIQETGLFAGAADLQDAVIAGRFEGSLSVAGRLTVKSTGRVFGEIHYGVLEVEAGARLEGQFLNLEPMVEQESEDTAANAGNVEAMYAEEQHAVEEERPRVFRRAVGY